MIRGWLHVVGPDLLCSGVVHAYELSARDKPHIFGFWSSRNGRPRLDFVLEASWREMSNDYINFANIPSYLAIVHGPGQESSGDCTTHNVDEDSLGFSGPRATRHKSVCMCHMDRRVLGYEVSHTM